MSVIPHNWQPPKLQSGPSHPPQPLHESNGMPQAAGALKRASRGGLLVGGQLLAISTTLAAGQRLQRSVLQGAKAAGSTGVRGVFTVLSSRAKVSAGIHTGLCCSSCWLVSICQACLQISVVHLVGLFPPVRLACRLVWLGRMQSTHGLMKVHLHGAYI